MSWKARDLIGYGMHATDGPIGTISDLLSDDREWTMHWVVAGPPGADLARLDTRAELGRAEGVPRRDPRSGARQPGTRPVEPDRPRYEERLYGCYGYGPPDTP